MPNAIKDLLAKDVAEFNARTSLGEASGWRATLTSNEVVAASVPPLMVSVSSIRPEPPTSCMITDPSMLMTLPGAKEKMLDGTRVMTTCLIADTGNSEVIARYSTTLLAMTGRSSAPTCLMVYIA